MLAITTAAHISSVPCADVKSLYKAATCCLNSDNVVAGLHLTSVINSPILPIESESLSQLQISGGVMGLSGDGKTAVVTREDVKDGEHADFFVRSSIPGRDHEFTLSFVPSGTTGYENWGYFPTNFRKIKLNHDGTVIAFADSIALNSTAGGMWPGRMYVYKYHQNSGWHKHIDFQTLDDKDVGIGWEDAVSMNGDGSLIAASLYDNGAKANQLGGDGFIEKDVYAWKWDGTTYAPMPVGANNLKMGNVVSILHDGSEMMALDRINQHMVFFRNTGTSWANEYAVDFMTYWPGGEKFDNVNFADYRKLSSGERVVLLTSSGKVSVYRFSLSTSLSALTTPSEEHLHSDSYIYWPFTSKDGDRIVLAKNSPLTENKGIVVYDYHKENKDVNVNASVWDPVLEMYPTNYYRKTANADATRIFMTFSDDDHMTADSPPQLIVLPK